jgi:branched-chain amino acid transport system substrate-binding protein
MLKKGNRILLIIGFIVIITSCVAASRATVDEPRYDDGKIRIGVIGPMGHPLGKAHWNGALLAEEEINKSGGIKVGDRIMKIALYKADSQGDKDYYHASKAMEKLITEDRVDFIVGGFYTGAVLKMQDTAMRYKKIFLGCGCAYTELCDRVEWNYKKYKYWFRVSPQNVDHLYKHVLLITGSVVEAVRNELNIAKPEVACVFRRKSPPDSDSLRHLIPI